MEDDRFDSDDDAWFASLIFWRPSKLSDEQMQIHFARFDGKWSEQTKSRMTETGSRGLQLDSNWAMTRRSWRCPICHRGKSDLFRQSLSGVLLAKLDQHHDHLRDSLWRRSFELFGEDWRQGATAGFADRMDAIEILLDRFRPCLICHECNAADGTAKRAVAGMDSRFSFAPTEIERFVRPRPGTLHEIDIPVAEDIWQTNKADFERRLELRDVLLNAVHAGHLAVNGGAKVGQCGGVKTGQYWR